MNKILITGGSRGIGADMVRYFCEKGYKVAFTYKSSKKEADLLSEETGAFAICADSANESEVISAVRQAEEFCSGIDALINNAAISSFALFTDIKTEDWKRIFDVNVNGAYYYTREVLPKMIEKKQGRIINISSMWGISGASCEVHYSATKAALIGMTKALAKELGPSKITVNCIAPGVIDTDMNKSLSENDRNALIDETPVCRLGTARDISRVAHFLCEDASDFITGQVLSVDGGFII